MIYKLFAATVICLIAGTSTFAQEAVQVGDSAPDFEIETFDGGTIKLSDRFGNDGRGAILLFSRANW